MWNASFAPVFLLIISLMKSTKKTSFFYTKKKSLCNIFIDAAQICGGEKAHDLTIISITGGLKVNKTVGIPRRIQFTLFKICIYLQNH